jgi:hypothetical protein
MTAAEVAASQGCSEQNVRARAARGTLPGVKTSSGWRFDPKLIESEVL